MKAHWILVPLALTAWTGPAGGRVPQGQHTAIVEHRSAGADPQPDTRCLIRCQRVLVCQTASRAKTWKAGSG